MVSSFMEAQQWFFGYDTKNKKQQKQKSTSGTTTN